MPGQAGAHLPPVRAPHPSDFPVGPLPGHIPGPSEFPALGGQPAFAADPFAPALGGFFSPGNTAAPGMFAAESPAEVPTGVGPGVAYDPLGQGDLLLYHISCPNKHELEVPADMLEQDVLCPQCGEQFRLRAKDSREEKERRRLEREARDAHRAKLWLNWAVLVGTFIVIGVLVMIIIAATQ